MNNEYENGVLVNSGYYCCYAGGQCGCKLTCDWLAQSTPINISGNNYIQFTAPINQNRVVTADGCNCLADYSIAVPNITDPYTGEVGYACQLTALGNTDMLSGTAGEVFQHYKNKAAGVTPCV